MQMVFEQSEVEGLKRDFRNRINDIFKSMDFLSLSAVDISEVLVASAFAWRDYNGGTEDVRHAAKCLREIVDRLEADKIKAEEGAEEDMDDDKEE